VFIFSNLKHWNIHKIDGSRLEAISGYASAGAYSPLLHRLCYPGSAVYPGMGVGVPGDGRLCCLRHRHKLTFAAVHALGVGVVVE